MKGLLAFVVGAFLALPGATMGTPESDDHLKEGWSCIKDHGLIRLIRITRPEGKRLPCQVIYEKPTEDNSKQLLWTARYEKNFCSDKAEGLAMRLGALDWECENVGVVHD